MSIEELAQVERDASRDAERSWTTAEARAGGRCARPPKRSCPDVEARLVHLYKMGRAGYWRLLLNVDDMRALGRAYRTASALTAIDRARVDGALRRHSTPSRASARRSSARAEEIGALQAEATPRAGGPRQGAWPPAPRSSASIDAATRPQCAAHRRAAGRAAAAAGVGGADRRRSGGRRGAPAAAVPGGSALARARHRRPPRSAASRTADSGPPSSETVSSSRSSRGRRSAASTKGLSRLPTSSPDTATW